MGNKKPSYTNTYIVLIDNLNRKDIQPESHKVAADSSRLALLRAISDTKLPDDAFNDLSICVEKQL
jgi:hypothetical protein